MIRQSPHIELVPAAPGRRDFVEKLSADVFSSFGDYDRTLPEMMDLPWMRTVIAEAHGEAVGFAMYSLEDLVDAEIDLIAIAVAPRWQSRGVGRRLLARVESEALSLVRHGAPIVRLTVAEDNTPARGLFERSGYAPVPGESGSYPRGQRSIVMRKRIR